MKYSLSPKKIPRAEPEGFSKGSSYISLYILNQIIRKTLSISKNDTSSIVFPGWAILDELTFRIALAACICIRTRGGISYEIWPVSYDILTRVLIQTLYHSYE